jgi:hypothetical protein
MNCYKIINNPILDTMVCEDSSIISLADDGGIELRNYNIYPF